MGAALLPNRVPVGEIEGGKGGGGGGGRGAEGVEEQHISRHCKWYMYMYSVCVPYGSNVHNVHDMGLRRLIKQHNTTQHKS